MMINLPVSYLYLKMGYPPTSVFIVGILMALVNLTMRLVMLRKMIELPIKEYFMDICMRLLATSIIAYIIPYVIIHRMDMGIVRFITVGFIGLVSSCASIYFIGLIHNEKKYINKYIVIAKNKMLFFNLSTIKNQNLRPINNNSHRKSG